MTFSAIVLAGYLLTGDASVPPLAAKHMSCETGPVHRIFGQTKWLVYSCDDQASMVIVTEPGNPASPFYFMLHKQGDTYAISGEGTGDKAASDAAGKEISSMSADELVDLLADTKKK